MATPGQKLTLEIATPSGLALQATADRIEAPSVNGEFGVLPGFLPIIAALRAGVVHVHDGSKRQVFAVGAGFVEASDNRVQLITDSFAEASQINGADASKEVDDAANALKNFSGDPNSAERDELERNLGWAKAKEEVARLSRH